MHGAVHEALVCGRRTVCRKKSLSTRLTFGHDHF